MSREQHTEMKDPQELSRACPQASAGEELCPPEEAFWKGEVTRL